ncbi:uncharacterized protein LOC143895354 [Temnothorax americanus]|uniref:uncharacterized protein LOC143895354 n=1 Tax=Temnothorax americanus TaxID=1964332 RepID=UPI0040696F3D
MERKELDELTHVQLQEQASKFGLPVTGTRDQLIDYIMLHVERNRPADPPENRGATVQSTQAPSNIEQPPLQNELISSFTNVFERLMGQMATQQQQFLQQISSNVQRLNDATPAPPESQYAATLPHIPSTLTHGSMEGSRLSVMSSVSPANAVHLLASQIPEYGGGSDENVQRWVQRVDQVALAHRVADDVTLLAASSKLTKLAKKWYNTQSGPVLTSWMGCRQALLKMFERKLPFYVVMQKIEARKWMPSKETFQEYAIDKLALMHNQGVPIQDTVDLLIGGIAERSLRATAAAIPATSVEQFVDQMCQITSAVGTFERKSSDAHKSSDNKAINCKKCGKKDHSQKDCKDTEITCFFCKGKGHRKVDCPKWKKKNSSTPGESPAAVAAVKDKDDVSESTVVASESAAEVAEVPISTVAAVQQDAAVIPIKDPIVKIVQLNGKHCDLSALMDTGSPVSFVKDAICKKFGLHDSSKVIETKRKFTTLNDYPIPVKGIVRASISLDSYPNKKYEFNLYILEKDNFTYDLVIGRDFMENKVTLSLHANKEVSDIKFFPEDFMTTDICTAIETERDYQIDFGEDVKEKLKQVIREVEEADIPVVDNGYAVRVKLRDPSIYAYALRRLAYEERRQVREIIDDLLARGIIKPSTSPYCARIVLVRKKNGKLRLCVDFRPLNARMWKQKFPFPVIEDCIAEIRDNKVFTSLDLKDSFYQVKVHPDDTKYFAFATPDGQYESTVLPFGWSESAAEF